MDGNAESQATQVNRPPGLVLEADNLSVWVKTWAQVLQDNRSRLGFLREKLEYGADRVASLEKLRTIYESLNLPGGQLEPDIEIADEQPDSATLAE